MPNSATLESNCHEAEAAEQITTPVVQERVHASPSWPGRLPAPSSILMAVLMVLFVVVVLRCAWVTEDAFIMFRTIDNALHGHGLTWNVTERVQVYTCPLWMFVLLTAIWITGKFYYTTIVLSVAATSATALLLVHRLAPSRAAAALGLTALTLSKGYMDYATSGLENPLTHLLLAMFCVRYWRIGESPNVRDVFSLSFLASLVMTNRLDAGLMVLPTLAYVAWQVPKRRGCAAGVLGMAPLISWELFSLIYYGFPFPNTAYAKLNLGMTTLDLAHQGLKYFANAAKSDPLTLLLIAAGMATPFFARRWRDLPLLIGIDLYLLYIVKIGGDYMSLRFFTAPLLLAVLLLVRAPVWQQPRAVLAAVCVFLAVSLASPRCPLLSGRSFGTGTIAGEVDRWGIADERGFYHRGLGLFNLNPRHLERIREGNRLAAPKVTIAGCVGLGVFLSAEREHIVDFCALGDALLARLPKVSTGCRVGHYARHLPEGYVASHEQGVNLLADPKLAQYYDKLRTIISGPLWTRERWQAIWEMNTGQLNHLVDVEHYRQTGAPPHSRPETPSVHPPKA